MANAAVHRVDTGTLSATFIAEGEKGQRKFLKTHLVDQGRNTLRKESAILAALYQPALDVQYIEMGGPSKTQIWLVMNALAYPQEDYTLDEVWELLSYCTKILRGSEANVLITEKDSIITLVAEGWAAFVNLSQRGLLSTDVQKAVHGHLARVESEIEGFAPHLCHGDLGPKNLMFDGRQPFVIDWEDAFWGVEGYDFLYWLTFFNNRKYYSPNLFGQTALGKPMEAGLLVMILLLKCELSFRNNTYKKNTLDFNQRIQEILDLV